MNMTTPLAAPQQSDSLGRAIWISIATHVAVVLVFVVRMVIYPSEPLRLDDAIRVDIVALPDKGPKLPSLPVVDTKPLPPTPVEPAPLPPVDQPKLPDPAPVAKVAPKPDSPKVNLKKTKQAQEAALKRLEALEKIERMTKSQPRANAPAPVKGNQISKGSNLSGVIRLEQQGYLQTIDGAVKSHWNLPGFLSNANLSARARLYIDAKGNIIKRTITQSSHNDVYDQRVLTAIDTAGTLPPPPSSLSSILENDGIELEFVPQ